jgi:opacity protein-like surface antigen
MKTVLLSTVAAAVLALAGAASAQNQPDQATPAPERAPAAQQHAPAEKVAPAMKPGERKAPGNAQLNQGRHETTGAEPKAEEKSEMKSDTKVAPGKSMNKTEEKSNTRTKMDDKAGAKVDSKSNAATNAKTNDNNKSSTEMRGKTENETTAQGSVATGAKLSTEQRTKIVSVFRQHKVEPVRVNFSVRVGARLPESVHFYPVPTEVVEVYPEWRGYDYILVGDQILIIDPRSHEIVAILEA